jgi:hypothetical protein
MNNFIYQLAFQDRTEEFTLPQLEIRYTIIGRNSNPSQRTELQGQPLIKDFLGPMYNGVQNGVTVVRYETKDVYASYD